MDFAFQVMEMADQPKSVVFSAEPAACAAVPHLSPKAAVMLQGKGRHGSQDSRSRRARQPAMSLLHCYQWRNRNILAPNPPPATPGSWVSGLGCGALG